MPPILLPHNSEIMRYLAKRMAECTPVENEAILRALLTPAEAKMINTRLTIGKLLLSGKTGTEVIEQVEVSTATTAKVNQQIQYGDGGYAILFKTTHA